MNDKNESSKQVKMKSMDSAGEVLDFFAESQTHVPFRGMCLTRGVNRGEEESPKGLECRELGSVYAREDLRPGRVPQRLERRTAIFPPPTAPRPGPIFRGCPNQVSEIFLTDCRLNYAYLTLLSPRNLQAQDNTSLAGALSCTIQDHANHIGVA